MIDYRLAQTQDASGILSVLEEIAGDIPLRLDALDGKDRITNISQKINEWCNTNESWVAVTHSNQVVGFLLIEPDNTGLYIQYAGVSKLHQGQQIFPKLIRMVMAKKMPLTAVVKHANKSSMSCRLTKLGFTMVSFSDSYNAEDIAANNEDKFRWYPAGYQNSHTLEK